MCDTKGNTIPQNTIHSTWCAFTTWRNFYSTARLVHLLQVGSQKQEGAKSYDEGCTHLSSTAANRTQLPGTSSEPGKDLVKQISQGWWVAFQWHWLFKIILKERMAKSWVVGRFFCFVFLGGMSFQLPFPAFNYLLIIPEMTNYLCASQFLAAHLSE